MIRPGAVGNYLVITPAKDEEKFIADTFESVIHQTIRPRHWLLVDDGSTDSTPAIIASYAEKYDWISGIRIDRTAERKLGSAEVQAFTVGYQSIRHLSHEYVVKLDADLTLPPDYFEQMLSRMNAQPRLGIASGVYLEDRRGSWTAVILPKYHAAGAAKMVRVACFEAIGGFPLMPGWDTADEIKAWAHGWETTHFPELEFRHLKPEGSSAGSLKTSYHHGQIYYVCGGGLLFFAAKVIERAVKGNPPLLAGLLLLSGYVNAFLTRTPKLVSPNEATHYRHLLNRRITGRLSL